MKRAPKKSKPFTPTIVVYLLAAAGVILTAVGVYSPQPTTIKFSGVEISSSSVGIVLIALAILVMYLFRKVIRVAEASLGSNP